MIELDKHTNPAHNKMARMRLARLAVTIPLVAITADVWNFRLTLTNTGFKPD
jgi:hypothetical protein